MELYKYEKDSNSNTYPKGYKLQLEPFPDNSSNVINDFYVHIKQSAPTTIEFSIFNEKYLSSYTYNESSDYYYIVSMEKIGPNQFAIFYNSKNTTLIDNTIRIASFNFKNETFNFIKSYTIDEINRRGNCYCVKTNNNNIVCGLIEIEFIKTTYSFKDTINYNLILLQEGKPNQKINILNITSAIFDSYLNGLFRNHFIKFIPLQNEKIIYCFYDSLTIRGMIRCGLVQVITNSKLQILIGNTLIFNRMQQPNYLRRNLF